MNLKSIGRFVSGMAVGLFVAAIFWSYSASYYAPVSLIRGIVGSIVLSLGCGVVATVGSIDKLMDNLNLPFF